MHVATDYLHALEGRLRIKVPGIKGSSVKAEELEKQVAWQPGIDYVKANPTTGNVLIYYDVQKIEQESILRTLQESGYLRTVDFRSPDSKEAKGATASIMENLVASVTQSLMEVALTKLVTAII